MVDEIAAQVQSLEVRVAVMEKLLIEHETRIALQLGRILADIESEKGARLRLHEAWEKRVDELQKRMRSLEHRMAIGIGIIVTLQIVVPILIRFIKP